MFLEKMLQSQGFGARKHCQQLIKNGAVSINGVVVDNPKEKLKLDDLEFEVYQEKYTYREKVYIALNKPKGYECSHQSTHHFSVFDLFDDILTNRGIQCVGRLDQDTTGLLLLTDDGQFLQALTHPKKHVPKVYKMLTADEITDEQVQQLEAGVELRNETGIFAATDVTRLSSNELQMTVHQGVYHQVKRMIAAVGNKVESLHRQQIGQFDLGDIAEGEWIYLTEEQIQLAKQRDE
ncbi:pseudouridine synthase [Acinetobacter faecalis]|uniref:Pseudouridine synthase n=1 Tax=Acinetobacter faecalis TaxID=2665161 RepID=A0AB35UUR5_9GAMM|nr:16S rRNA pseudouridine(516) synthase [Acinetobacter faecalis]MDY6458295.1 16S rRNA pseudouridine(516) synthase [Acinetobacter faecalis]MDY6487009.1 16S rRNA pseudouridine(516) synthase [Acinetobacter faecalis]MDY6510759.1 16S rRNA pseudouridine(516) synthase [Acinetobacter faecalis]MDY6530574.1 16S rRNA pseudouridine(516) synthase [Acinetobacter faecalis]MDY6549177.1 16S rRNA pseudouridine(516) synthase [Acinetobacter faecalis]